MKINIPIGLLSLLFVLSASVQLKAQTAPVVQMLEGGTFVGISGPLGCYRGGSNAVGPMFGLDMRYNFEKTPYDVGILFSFEMADRKYHLPECEMGRTQRNRVLFFGLIGDYNFRQSRKINPFIGIGIGMAHIDNVWSNVYPLHATVKPSFMLQGGCRGILPHTPNRTLAVLSQRLQYNGTHIWIQHWRTTKKKLNSTKNVIIKRQSITHSIYALSLLHKKKPF